MTEVSEPKSAATVILLRPAQSGSLEVFLTRRPDRMDFLGGAYVFPGGTVRKEDCSEGILKRCAGISPHEARQALGAHLRPDTALGHWVAGIRELFEETGVLLAMTPDGRSAEVSDEKRRSVAGKQISFRELLESENLFCNGDGLRYVSHWLTPEEFAIRFDTRFFIAVLPLDQTPLERSEEVAHALWLTPERAMQLYARGSLPMIFPTYASLRTLADFDSVESLFAEYGKATP
jgi:8-oxo-dGTP pyrophosphatase MutT (NUDIX family)